MRVTPLNYFASLFGFAIHQTINLDTDTVTFTYRGAKTGKVKEVLRFSIPANAELFWIPDTGTQDRVSLGTFCYDYQQPIAKGHDLPPIAFKVTSNKVTHPYFQHLQNTGTNVSLGTTDFIRAELTFLRMMDEWMFHNSTLNAWTL